MYKGSKYMYTGYKQAWSAAVSCLSYDNMIIENVLEEYQWIRTILP